MKIKVLIWILFLGGFFLNACQKDIDVFIPDPGQLNGPDSSWHTAITAAMPVSTLKNSLAEAPYFDSIEVNAATATILTPTGVLVTFPPFCTATSTGQPVTGKVDVEIQVVKKKGDMIRFNKPSTMNDSLLVTAGEIFIRLRKNGLAVLLAPNIKLKINYVDLPVSTQMKLFLGDETHPDYFNWLPKPASLSDSVTYSTQGYEIFTSQLNWISLAYGYNFNTTPGVKLSPAMASYFTNANTVVFTVFKDFRSVVAMRADLSSRKFVSGNLPVGKQVTVVVISKQANDYYLGHESAVTQAVATSPFYQPVNIVPVKKSLPEILTYLSSL